MRSPWSLVSNELAVVDGMLTRGTRLVPPESLRNNIVQLAHEGHMGISKTKERIRQDFWWPGLDLMVERVVRDCVPCFLSDKILKPRQSPMVCRKLPMCPWDEVAIDIVGPLQGEHQTLYLIVLLDLYSCWVEVSSVRDITTQSIIKFLDSIFKRESFPRSLMSDNGPQFCSCEMEDYLVKCGIEHKKISLYHPESNGAIERLNKTLKESIQLARVNSLNWREELQNRISAYRFTPHSSTGKTPFELFKGRSPNTILCPGLMILDKASRIIALGYGGTKK